MLTDRDRSDEEGWVCFSHELVTSLEVYAEYGARILNELRKKARKLPGPI